MLIIIFILSYIIGSINYAIIVCTLLKAPSPKNFGSKNPGATNVLRVAGKIAAVITLFADMLKGYITVFSAYQLNINQHYITYIFLITVVAHTTPFLYYAKGGKGVATFLGCLFAYNWILGVIMCQIWIFTYVITRYSSLSSLLSVSITSFIFSMYINSNNILPLITTTMIILVRHYSNIRHLILKKEKKLF
jgi:glycerol-3-phosphate acyltransferase PlsY